MKGKKIAAVFLTLLMLCAGTVSFAFADDIPSPEEPVVEEIIAEQSAVEEPEETEPVAEPAGEEPTGEEPVTEEPVAEPEAEPVVEEPVVEEPAQAEPVAEEPAETEPVAEPAGEEPTQTEPVAEPVVEPETEPEAEPVVEPEAEPEAEPMVEEPETEPVAEEPAEETAKDPAEETENIDSEEPAAETEIKELQNEAETEEDNAPEEAPVSENNIEEENPVENAPPAEEQPEKTEEEAPVLEIPEREEEIIPVPENAEPGLTGKENGLKKVADFFGADGSVKSIAVGDSADLNEFVRSLGYTGEISSAVSSNPNVLDVVDGKLVVKDAFGDETLTLVIDGREVIIKAHDPTEILNIAGLRGAFANPTDTGGYYLTTNIDLTEDGQGNLTLASGKTLILDLNGYVLKGIGNGSVITVNSGAEFTLVDSPNSSAETHKGYTDSNGLWHYDPEGKHKLIDGETEKNISGGIITGGYYSGNSSSTTGGGVTNSGTFTMNGGTIAGNITGRNGGGVNTGGMFTMINGEITGNKALVGGGVYVGSGTFTMSGGTISGNTATNGGGVYNGGQFTMANGTISGNTATSEGGGMYNNSTFTMNGGTISGNTATNGGGVFFSYGSVALGGTAQISGNTANNLYLYDEMTVSIGTEANAPKNGMLIGVTLRSGSGDVTEDHGEAAKYFNSDNASYVPVNKDSKVQLGLAAAKRTDSSGALIAKYLTVQEAVDSAANTDKVVLLADCTENVQIGGKTIVLDLNGFVLQGTDSGSVITVNSGAEFTLVDSPNSSAETHKGYTDENGLWHLGEIPSEEIGCRKKDITGGIITGGKATSGGGVNNSGTFTMTGGTISGNTASSTGGGVRNYGTFTMIGGEITGNTSKIRGGGVSDYGKFEMTGGTISGNTAANYGGGVYIDTSGTVTLGGTAEITDNHKGSGTSASDNNLYLDSGNTVTVSSGKKLTSGANIGVTTYDTPSANLKYVNITGTNSADYSAYFTSDNSQYVVFNDSKDKTIKLAVPVAQLGTESTAVKYATVQKAIDAAGTGTAESTVMMLRDSTENVVIAKDQKIILDLDGHILNGGNAGSVITINTGAALTLKDSNTGTLTHKGYIDGNGLWHLGPVLGATIKIDITGGIITGGKATYMGAGVVNQGIFTMEGGTIAGNSAEYGAGVANAPGAQFTMKDGMVTGNTASVSVGGGVLNQEGTFTMENGTISGNTATSDGGGVYNTGSNAQFILSGGTISGNTATTYGGGVYNDETGTFTMNGGTIGGAENNKNSAAYGGGVYNNGTFTMNGDSEISGNTATSNGGGVYVTSGTFTMNGDSKITGNTATSNGGGVYVNTGAQFTVNGGTIGGTDVDKNTAQNGGGVYNAGQFAMANGTITGNTASDKGDGVYNGGTFNMSGGGITGNTTENLYLPSGKTMSVAEGFNGAVGVTTEDIPEVGIPVVICDTLPSSYSGGISADDPDLVICDVTDGTKHTLKSGIPVAEAGGKKYLSIQDAINDAGSDPVTVSLKTNVTENITIPEGKNITLDLSGKTLQAKDTAGAVITNNGTLTLTDTAGSSSVTGGAKGVVQNGTMTLAGGINIGGNKENLYLPGGKTVSVAEGFNGAVGVTTEIAPAAGIPVVICDTLPSDYRGGISSDDSALILCDVTDGTKHTLKSGVPTAEVNGKTYVSIQDAINDAGSEPVTISLKTDVTENITIPEGKNITLDLSGKTLRAQDTAGAVITNNGTLTLTDTAGSSSVTGGTKGVVQNGTMTLAGGINIDGNKENLYLPGGKTVSVAEGFNGFVGVTTEEAPAALIPVVICDTLPSNYGGRISADDPDLVICDVTEGTSHTLKCGIPVAEAGGKKYLSIQDAINDAGSDSLTISLKTDVTENITIPEGKNITLELNGKVLTGSDTDAGSVITVEGTFTLADSVGTGKVTGGTAENGGGVYNSGTFTMEGGSITGNTASLSGGGVYNSGTFTMNGGSITGNESKTAFISGGGVYNGGEMTVGGSAKISDNTTAGLGGGIANTGTLTVDGGEIAKNTAKNCGGGIGNVEGTVSVNGGSITGNSAKTENPIPDSPCYGGGVYNVRGTLNVTGGSITGNEAMSGGSGVYNTDKMTVGGNAQITGNTTDNLYLPEGVTVSVAEGFKGSVGVTTEIAPAAGTPVDITGSSSADFSSGFTSDNAEYTVINSGSGSAQVVQLAVPGHIHDWRYAAGGSTVSASCGNEGCDVTENLSLTIHADSAVYDGNPHGAAFTGNALAGLTELPAISYFMKDANGEYSIAVKGVPTEIGNYLACFTVKDATGKYMYSITKEPIPPKPDPKPDPTPVPAPAPAPINAHRYTPEEKEVVFDPVSEAPLELTLKHTGGAPITEEEFASFVVMIDGKVLSAENSVITAAEDGSTVITAEHYVITILANGDIIITISADYLKTLEAGNHDLVVEFSGSGYHTTLVVK